MAAFVRTRRVTLTGIALLAGAVVACATGGDGSGIGTVEPGDSGSHADTGSGASDSGGGSNPDTNAGGVDTGSETQSTPDTGGGVETGGPAVDSGTCLLTGKSVCANGAECCFLNNVAECDCQAGTATQGGTCSSTVSCAPGYVCGVPSGSTTGTCLAWCVYPGGACGAGTTCQALISPSPVVDGVTYGECH